MKIPVLLCFCVSVLFFSCQKADHGTPSSKIGANTFSKLPHSGPGNSSAQLSTNAASNTAQIANSGSANSMANINASGMLNGFSQVNSSGLGNGFVGAVSNVPSNNAGNTAWDDEDEDDDSTQTGGGNGSGGGVNSSNNFVVDGNNLTDIVTTGLISNNTLNFYCVGKYQGILVQFVVAFNLNPSTGTYSTASFTGQTWPSTECRALIVYPSANNTTAPTKMFLANVGSSVSLNSLGANKYSISISNLTFTEMNMSQTTGFTPGVRIASASFKATVS